ncbi:zinc finger transcription factor YY1-like isoform X1 [Phragmites australis]|uniref:zinc finger transcription factor YY1-like isoform X1 n=1 Tax=Phragmites australis TaxID=29695 RepID=UPI002D78C04D|nr:zinc finger transcription factor YY1-like isoform X1 [Phragmites australis]
MEYPAAPAGSGGYKYYYPPPSQPHSQTLRRPPRPAARWVKQWIPQDLAASGGKCSLFKWVREDGYKNSKENPKVPEAEAPKPEPTTEILFLCSYENCGKTFVDVSALRKHAHVHGEKQYICQEPNCGKKFVDSSKLKRHYLTHTGQKDFVCPHPGCGKAFSLDFNLRSHLKTHALENYHICPFPACGKRFTSDFKLKAHVKAHEKTGTPVAVQHTPPSEKPQSTTKPSTPATTSYAERPYVCPYEGCEKAYIHSYKLNLHLKTQHPEHGQEENGKLATPSGQHAVNEPYQYNYAEMGDIAANPKRSKANPVHKAPPSKVYNVKVSNAMPADTSGVKKQWSGKAMYDDDSEETEEDQGNNIEDDWRYGNNVDDEETQDED